MSYQAVDQKKEDFRRYLDKNGIIDALTKVLVGLYEETEKPENPLDFIKQFLGSPSEIDVEALRQENEALKKRVEELQTSLDEFTKKEDGEEGAGEGTEGVEGTSESNNAAGGATAEATPDAPAK